MLCIQVVLLNSFVRAKNNDIRYLINEQSVTVD